MPDDLHLFSEFINNQLDMGGLDEAHHLTDEEIERYVMPLIQDDIRHETLQIVDQLLRNPQDDHWRAQLAPFHREIRRCLVQIITYLMQRRYADRLSANEWADATRLIVTVAWLVRKQMDGDDALPYTDEN